MVNNLKRLPLTYIRDRAKSKYDKGTECSICGETEGLDYHHYNGLSELYHRWTRKNNLDENDVVAHRDRFIEEHHEELYVLATTLCHAHHLKLHSVYGKNPGLGTAIKQARWVDIQREKHVV